MEDNLLGFKFQNHQQCHDILILVDILLLVILVYIYIHIHYLERSCQPVYIVYLEGYSGTGSVHDSCLLEDLVLHEVSPLRGVVHLEAIDGSQFQPVREVRGHVAAEVQRAPVQMEGDGTVLSGILWLAGMVLKSGPLTTTLEAVIFPVVLVTVMTGASSGPASR